MVIRFLNSFLEVQPVDQEFDVREIDWREGKDTWLAAALREGRDFESGRLSARLGRRGLPKRNRLSQ